MCAVAVLMAVLVLTAVQAAREADRRVQSSKRFRQLGLALHIHHDEKHRFPAAASYDKDGKKLLSWRVHILPYLQLNELYEKFHLDEPWDSEHNRKLIPLMPKVFQHPNLPAADFKTNYLVPVGKGTIFDDREGMEIGRITDGTSNTIMIVEANPDRAVVWTKPEDLEVDREHPLAGLGKLRPRGFLVGFGDASVHAIPNDVEPTLLWALFTRAGGERVELP